MTFYGDKIASGILIPSVSYLGRVDHGSQPDADGREQRARDDQRPDFLPLEAADDEKILALQGLCT